MEILHQRLRELRTDAKVSLKEMAAIIGVEEATVQRYESGKIKHVPYNAIVAYAEKFGYDPAYIMGWLDESKSDISPNTVKMASSVNEIMRDPVLKETLQRFMTLTPKQRQLVIDTINMLSQKEE